jgi:hypothetical protein
MFVFALVALAHATSSPSLGLTASGEAVFGEALNSAYRATSLGCELHATVPFRWNLEGKLSLGYRRLTNPDNTDDFLWYSPLSVTLGFVVPAGRATLFADLGPSYVLWGTTPTASPDQSPNGGNFGAVVEAGAQIGRAHV